MRRSLKLGLSIVCMAIACRPAPPPTPIASPPREPERPSTGGDPFVDVAIGYQHGCAVRRSGSVLCWGKNTYGELGGGERQANPAVRRVRDVNDAVEVVTGRDFACVRTRAANVRCWGNNQDGQLGDGRGGAPGRFSLGPTLVTGLSEVVALTAGEYHACALERSGRVWCWGNGADGQIGSDAARVFAAPRSIAPLGPVQQIAAGRAHVCALLRKGQVECWGRNTERQLGDPRSGGKVAPVSVAGAPSDVRMLAAGHHHTCVLRQSGGVACWGSNDARQLGQNAAGRTRNASPTEIAGLPPLSELVAGGDQSCGRARDGRWWCWGATASTSSPRPQPLPMSAAKLAAGAERACGVTPAGALSCVGDASGGALGPWQPRRS